MIRKPRLVVLPPQHLGHEIHVGRNIVVDMCSKGILSSALGDCVMTGLADRRFLYETLFAPHQVYDFSMVPGLPQPIKPPKSPSEYLLLPSSFFNAIDAFAEFQIVNLSGYSLPPTYCTFGTSDEMQAVGYTVPDAYWNERYLEYAKKFNFSTAQEINTYIPITTPVYIVIHHRYNASIENLKRMLNSLPPALKKVIFTSNLLDLSSQLNEFQNTFFTDELKSFASLLNDPRCKLLISEWSGAGQVAQYTLGPQAGVWYYYDHYADIYNFTMTHKIWELNAKLGNYFNCWDFKNISGCDIQHYSSFESLMKAVSHIRLN
jgi:hypothetical protein